MAAFLPNFGVFLLYINVLKKRRKVKFGLTEVVLRIRRGKLGKEMRLIPLADRVTERLRTYVGERDRLLGHTPEPYCVTRDGDGLGGCAARHKFAQVCQRIGLRVPPQYRRHGRGTRIHDQRHNSEAPIIPR